jgi:mxaK protein
MKRRTAHALFAAAALGCGAIALYQGVRLHQATRINVAIAHAQDLSSFDETAPEARFARALAWSREGNFEAALQAYKGLSQSDDPALSLGALYNLGNLQLRAALKHGPDSALRSLPLIELAKQSYRDLLRRNPQDWDARYNLERALRLAPAADDPIPDEDPPEQEDRVMSTLPGTRLELP